MYTLGWRNSARSRVCSPAFKGDPVKHLAAHDPTELIQEEVCMEEKL